MGKIMSYSFESKLLRFCDFAARSAFELDDEELFLGGCGCRQRKGGCREGGKIVSVAHDAQRYQL